ncbi:MAG TPA: aminotransferase class I/II-fold pyridoxal phosphate-dependent enzyme [Vicinamibacterales bacterium]|nr:aminotransferase class I/II-fold pyridoxal phosphate-dependent enzyme [Vicinamibacterales bacterium]
MKFDTFAMERLQSTWENRVRWNLSESGVHPLRLDELVSTPALRDRLLTQGLGYPQTNGTPELRQAVANLYPDTTPDHVQITNGGSEANCVTLLHLIQPGDDVVMMTPNYMQVWGLARSIGANVTPWPLRVTGEGAVARWRPDVDELRRLVTPRTRAILICNPNNPTGARLDAGTLDAICAVAARSGAWIVSDEIYRGAELDGEETATVRGRYERTIVTAGLSKAYGLAGLRIGWVVAPPDVVEALWGIHDYTTIAPGALNDCLAQIALSAERRPRLIERTRAIIRTNYPIIRDWVGRHHGLGHVPPEAGAIVFVHYDYPIDSSDLIARLRDEAGVLIVPGAHFHMDGFLRIGFGSDAAGLTGALDRAGALLDSLLADAR